jgi:hypothetical protein
MKDKRFLSFQQVFLGDRQYKFAMSPHEYKIATSSRFFLFRTYKVDFESIFCVLHYQNELKIKVILSQIGRW